MILTLLTDSTCDIEHGFCKRGAEILHSWAESKEINQLFSKKKMFEFIPHKKTGTYIRIRHIFMLTLLLMNYSC